MSSIDATTIQSVIANQSLGFPPVEDGITYITDPSPEFTSGRAAQVPVLLGTNGQEFSIVPYLLGLNGQPLIAIAEALSAFLPVIGDVIVGVLEAILRDNAVYSLANVVITSLFIQCGTAELAQQLKASKHPVWRYYYNASFPNTEVFPGSGAYHSAEIYEVFGTYPRANATAQEIALSEYMQTAWASFAKDPFSGPGWPEYGSQGNIGNLGSNGDYGEGTIAVAEIDGLCIALSVLGSLGSLLASSNASSPLARAIQNVYQLRLL